MQYLLIDAHKRFLGTFSSPQTLAVGDTFENHTNNKIYTVVGLNWSKQNTPPTPSLTVIPILCNSRKVPQDVHSN